MEQTVLNALFNNAALLLVLSVVYEVSYFVPSGYRRLQPVINGFLIALICTAIMSMPFTLQPSVVFDTRSILISVTALIFGPIPTIITVIAAATMRLGIGGTGTLPGIAVIISSALIGLAWRRWLYPKSALGCWLNIYAMSISVHISMLACMLLLPYPDSLDIIRQIALPVMVIYPIASVLLSLLLIRQQEFRDTQDRLNLSEQQYRRIAENISDVVWTTDINLKTIYVSPSIEGLVGENIAAHLNRTLDEKFPPDSLFKIRAFLSEEIEKEKDPHSSKDRTRVLELEYYRADGTTIWLAMSISIIRDEKGMPIGIQGVSRDNTQIRKAEEELRASEEKYRRLFETMAQGVVYQSADGSIISANPAAERILGLTFDQLQGKTSMDPNWKSVREDGSELPGSEHPAMVALRTGEPVGPVVIGVFQPQINDHAWLSVNATPLFQPGEAKPSQVYAAFQDITAERQANKNYQLLFDKMVDAFALHEIICDEQGKPADYRFLAINPAFERMTGLKSVDALGKTVMAVIPDIEPDWIETYGRVALTGIPIVFNSFSIALDKHFEISAYQPSPNQFAVTFSDVTEQIRAQEKVMENLARLKESEEKYSSYIENAPYGVFVVNEIGQYVEANISATAITGYSSEELKTMSLRDLTADDSMKSAVHHFQALKSTGYMNVELKFIHKNGSIRWWDVNAVKLSENRYLGFSSDITEKKNAETNLISLINHDFLTNLYNRRFYETELQRLDMPNQLPLSIIVGDINGLKLINDSFGDAVGDKIIVASANLLSGCCRAGDILARTGGDEFSILLPKTSAHEAKELIMTIQTACEQYNLNAANHTDHVNLSIGTDTKETEDTDFMQVRKRADDYMNQRKLLEKNSLYNAIISSIKATMLEKSHETEAHAERITYLSREVGLKLKLSQTELDQIQLLATLHDIGKVGVAEEILKKPGSLDADEWVEMKKHPEIGYRIAMSSSNLAPIANYILCHHERWDGNGYPRNIKGTDIPLISRIISVVDAYDAMTEDRVYRKAMTHEKATAEIDKCAGTQFDPQIAKIFIEVLSDKMYAGQEVTR